MILISVPTHEVARVCRAHFGLRRYHIHSLVAYRGQPAADGEELLLFVNAGGAASTAATWGYLIARFEQSAPLVACYSEQAAQLCLFSCIAPAAGGRRFYPDLLVNPGLAEQIVEGAAPDLVAFCAAATQLLAVHQWHCVGLPASALRSDELDRLAQLLQMSATLQQRPGRPISAAEREIVQATARRLRLSVTEQEQLLERVRRYAVRQQRFPRRLLAQADSAELLADELRATERRADEQYATEPHGVANDSAQRRQRAPEHTGADRYRRG